MPSKAATAAPLAFGDVVLVPFPFTNQAGTKRRPAIVVSSRAYSIERPDVVLMAITSQLRPSPAFGEVWLSDWQSAGLLKTSAIKPVLATFEQRLVIRRLGALGAADAKTLKPRLSRVSSAPTPPPD